jgi:hydrogenase-4 component E
MGSWAYDVAHVLGGAILLCSFLLLSQRRLGGVIWLLAVQGVLLAAAAAWQAWAQEAPHLYASAVIALVAKGIAIPWALRVAVRRIGDDSTGPVPGGPHAALSPIPALLAGGALVALAILVALPVSTGSRVLTREDLAIALSILLLGLLMMCTRRHALAQAAGLLSMENALMLAAVGAAGMPLVVELSAAGLVLVVAALAGLFGMRMREHVPSLDTTVLDAHRGDRR